MIISGISIKEYIKEDRIVIKHLDDRQIQPASVDLSLAKEFLIPDENNIAFIDMKKSVKYRKICSNHFIVPPKSFVLAKTKEYVEVPLDLVAFVEGRSSIGRLGLFIQNAGWIDTGFKGTITLELFNACNVPIRLEEGRRICQIVFVKLDKELQKGYEGKYLGQVGVTGSKISDDFEFRDRLDEIP